MRGRQCARKSVEFGWGNGARCLPRGLDEAAAARLPPEARWHLNLFPSTIVNIPIQELLNELQGPGRTATCCIESRRLPKHLHWQQPTMQGRVTSVTNSSRATALHIGLWGDILEDAGAEP